jgi:hypothetical protein
MEHSLEVEKILDKLGNKYEALVRMSIVAKRLADEGTVPSSDKVTMAALHQYVDTLDQPAADPETKKK